MLLGTLFLCMTSGITPATAQDMAGSRARDEATGNRELRRAMVRIVTDLREVISLSGDGLPSDANRQQALRAAITRLDDQATLLEEHVGGDDAALMASALAQSSRMLRFAMSQGDSSGFERILSQTIQTCSACHTRKQPQAHATMSRVITATENRPSSVSGTLREVRLMVATREPEPAIERLEVLLLDPGVDVNQTLYGEALALHAAVTLLNLDAPVRLQAALERVRTRFRPGSSRHALLGQWLSDLNEYLHSPARLLQNDSTQAGLHLAAAEDLVAMAHAPDTQEPEQIEKDRIKYLLATRHAQIVHDDPAITQGSFARASYLLGLLENRLNPGSWLPLRELYLEQAILEAPHSELAESAYKLLETTLEAAYDGNAKAPEVEAHLLRLETLAKRR